MKDLLLAEDSQLGNVLHVEESLQPSHAIFMAITPPGEDPAKDGEAILLTKAQAIKLRDYIEALLSQPGR